LPEVVESGACRHSNWIEDLRYYEGQADSIPIRDVRPVLLWDEKVLEEWRDVGMKFNGQKEGLTLTTTVMTATIPSPMAVYPDEGGTASFQSVKR
jgi:hypothetical protein